MEKIDKSADYKPLKKPIFSCKYMPHQGKQEMARRVKQRKKMQ